MKPLDLLQTLFMNTIFEVFALTKIDEGFDIGEAAYDTCPQFIVLNPNSALSRSFR